MVYVLPVSLNVADFYTGFPVPHMQCSFSTACHHILSLHTTTTQHWINTPVTSNYLFNKQTNIKIKKYFTFTLVGKNKNLTCLRLKADDEYFFLTRQQMELRELFQQISLNCCPNCRSHKQSLPSPEELIWMRQVKGHSGQRLTGMSKTEINTVKTHDTVWGPNTACDPVSVGVR